MRQPARTFQDLIVWQKAHRFVLSVYQLTSQFSKSEIYGLTSQFKKAAISIPANIAEGFKKKGIADKARFLNISQASLEECRYYLIFANDLGYGDTSELMLQLEEVIPFWILDFRFWIGNRFVCLSSVNLSVAFFFQIGISKLLTSYINSLVPA